MNKFELGLVIHRRTLFAKNESAGMPIEKAIRR